MSSRVQPAATPALRDDAPRRGQVIDMASYRRRLDVRDHDSIVNALWNELTRLAQEAWTWRDPEMVEALEFHLAILKAHVHTDWQK
jgi:hypothetical protein